MKQKLLGSSALILATVIWGSAFVAQSVGMDHIGPFTFQAIRCALAVVGLLPVIFLMDKGKGFFQKWKDLQLWKAGILCAVPLFLAVNLQQLGIVTTAAGKSAFLTAMYIVLVPLLGALMGRKFSVMVPVSVVLGVIGLYLLSCAGVTSVEPGDLMLMGCALMFAVQILFVDKFAPTVDPLRLNCIQSGFCALGSAILMIFTEQPTWETVSACALPLCYTGFLSMGMAYSLQIIGQKYVESTAASLLMSLESVFALLCGWLILHESLSAEEAAGCILVLLAVVLCQIPVKPRKKRNFV